MNEMLSDFSCPLNPSIEQFLHINSIEFAKRGISVTYIVTTIQNDNLKILGFFTLANKIIELNRGQISRRTERLVQRFGELNTTTNTYSISAPLIAQFGKNFSNGLDLLISGKELMSLALEQVQAVQKLIGGRAVYLECEDNEKLFSFYTDLGYTEFDRRYTKDDTETPYYHQMMKFLKS
ncbi:MAG: N-acetyltransferase [Lachnospiraceae bacterium]|nr:N-acetyltransferase [Lachnospiraceae bacterium]